MKKFNSTICFLFLLLLCLFTPQLSMTSIARALVPKSDSTPPQPERNNAPSAFVTTTDFSIDDSGLTVNFGYPVGPVTVVVYDETNQIVCMGTVDTLTTSSFSTPTDTWDGGNYTINVTCAETTLVGDFDL